jgi:hypothetical protein
MNAGVGVGVGETALGVSVGVGGIGLGMQAVKRNIAFSTMFRRKPKFRWLIFFPLSILMI